MKTGSSSTFVVAWAQSEVDGLRNAPLTALTVGASWRWSGEAVCIDGARKVLVLDNAIGQAELQKRAAHSVRRLLGSSMAPDLTETKRERLFDGGFDLTDGLKRYEVSVIDDPKCGSPLLMFMGDIPAPDTELWVVSSHISSVLGAREEVAKATVCFTPNTYIMTPNGPKIVGELREGDMISTKDNGPQPLRWIGSRRISGARLFAMPELHPVRIKANALGSGQPDEDLIVSPHHRMLVSGTAAQELFNADEVLVSAQDLVNDKSVVFERGLRELSYIHLLFDAHQVIFANGLETESFHPSFAGLDELASDQLTALYDRFPEVQQSQDNYGPAARRTLTGAEAAILLHAVA